jgi:NADH-quinone oxidoreductase subunit G
MELGMSHRGEHAEIEAFVGATVDSELSGNMIDVCPVGALTSKPFRYSARTWELSRRKTISPHDSTGTHLVAQVKANRVMRVVPLENEEINECWIADRDRFSYEALNSPDRLTTPMVKQDGVWQAVQWDVALEYVANGLKDIAQGGAQQVVGALVSPHSTLEELALARRLVNGLGSTSIDHRLRHAAYPRNDKARWLGMPIAALSQLDRALVVGSNLRKDHPLFAQRIRQATRHGALVHALVSARELNSADAWAMKLASSITAPAHLWVAELAKVAAAVAAEKGVAAPMAALPDQASAAVARDLLSGKRSAVLLGNAAVHSVNSEALLYLAQWIAEHCGASHGVLTEAANTVGAHLVGATPGGGGLNAAQMLSAASSVQAMLLLNTEPEFDSRFGALATERLSQMKMVVGLTSFKTNLDCCDVLLPVTPFTETSGTFVNAEGRIQSFTAVVSPQGQARPAWKVLRVLGTMLGLPSMAFESSTDVLQAVFPQTSESHWVSPDRLGNLSTGTQPLPETQDQAPSVASIYQLDGLVRRASSLQLTADARRAALTTQGVA